MIHIFGANLTMQRLLVVIIAIVLMVALHLFIKYTTLGAAIRAVAQNRRGALLCGIHTERIAGITMAIGSGLAGVAGALIMYDRLISLGRHAPRPVAEGAPTEAAPLPVFGDPIYKRKQRIRARSQAGKQAGARTGT